MAKYSMSLPRPKSSSAMKSGVTRAAKPPGRVSDSNSPFILPMNRRPAARSLGAFSVTRSRSSLALTQPISATETLLASRPKPDPPMRLGE